MSCAERIETQVKVLAWCSGWFGIPYPCRQIKTELWFQYYFDQTRYVPSWFPFWEKREGCCEGIVYRWEKYVYWNSPKPYGWSYHNPPITMLFRHRLEQNGPCTSIPRSNESFEVD